ncbi:hypothetical protein Poly30_02290 [Planctomycetes bacterium Poly30]|uniref:Uncharacterized protein n=2 Tax=Saltatorellus ferox TaxID=2528018 RepID=A0A518EKX1_9BACT|nr:hypothetical protein Poly30_02290 [Planctomycetes bacterium Poly30]
MEPAKVGPHLRARVLLRTWVYPSFENWCSWTVFDWHCGRTGERGLRVRQATWLQKEDHNWLSQPTAVLRKGLHNRPTIEVADGAVDEEAWLQRATAIANIGLPSLAWPVSTIGIDGVAFGLHLAGRLELNWRNDPPEGWEPMAAWVASTREWLESDLLGTSA